jgi:hypothetical protein
MSLWLSDFILGKIMWKSTFFTDFHNFLLSNRQLLLLNTFNTTRPKFESANLTFLMHQSTYPFFGILHNQSHFEDCMQQQETMVSTGWSNKCFSYGVRPPWNPQQQQDLSNSCESTYGMARQVPITQDVIDRECHAHESLSTHSASYLVVMFTSLFRNQSTF